MDATMTEDSRELQVCCPQGLDIRGAFLLAKWAQSCAAEIQLEHDGFCADAKSLLAILRLGVLNDGLINVIIQGPEAAAALAGLEDLFRVQGPVLFAPAALIHNG